LILSRIIHAARKTTGPRGRDYVFLVLMANTGIRVGEAVRLRVDDCFGLARDPAFISIKTLKKRGHPEADVWLTPEIRQVLAGYVKSRKFSSWGDNPFLFGSRQAVIRDPDWERGMTTRTAQRIFHKYADQVIPGQPCRLHDLRHSFACRLSGNLAGEFLIQKALRHARPETTAIYALEGITPEVIVREMGKAGNLK